MDSHDSEIPIGTEVSKGSVVDRVMRNHQQSNGRTYCCWDDKQQNYWYIDDCGNIQRCQFNDLPIWAKEWFKYERRKGNQIDKDGIPIEHVRDANGDMIRIGYDSRVKCESISDALADPTKDSDALHRLLMYSQTPKFLKVLEILTEGTVEVGGGDVTVQDLVDKLTQCITFCTMRENCSKKEMATLLDDYLPEWPLATLYRKVRMMTDDVLEQLSNYKSTLGNIGLL